MKRVFGTFEMIFDICYLAAALVIGLVLLLTPSPSHVRMLAGIMALVLAGGDAFHLLPRILVIRTRQEEKFRPALGRGKQLTSITMTIFYLILWQIGLASSSGVNPLWTYAVYILCIIRIVLCLLPQNRWDARFPPVRFGLWRNIPFFLLGLSVALLFFFLRAKIPGFYWMWLAIILSFSFYLPVVLWSNKNPRIGMFMLPKTCAYLWMLIMCLSL